MAQAVLAAKSVSFVPIISPRTRWCVASIVINTLAWCKQLARIHKLPFAARILAWLLKKLKRAVDDAERRYACRHPSYRPEDYVPGRGFVPSSRRILLRPNSRKSTIDHGLAKPHQVERIHFGHGLADVAELLGESSPTTPNSTTSSSQ